MQMVSAIAIRSECDIQKGDGLSLKQLIFYQPLELFILIRANQLAIPITAFHWLNDGQR